MLPAGKEWHLFVSHSTADKDLVRGHIVVPMREQYCFKVKACYHCMPDPKRYDDKAIQRDMNQSCIVMIALSPPYIASPRYIYVLFSLYVCLFVPSVVLMNGSWQWSYNNLVFVMLLWVQLV